jgi:hypothetical protein
LYSDQEFIDALHKWFSMGSICSEYHCS